MTHRMNILQSPMVCAHRVTRGVKSRALFAVVILVGQGSLASAQTKPSASSLQLGQITCAAGRSQEEMWNTNTPERMPLTDDYQHQNIAEETTSWCIAETNETNLYVAFRVDTESNDGDIKPELTMLYELSESGEIARITQASRVKDQLEYVSVDHPSFNPYPVDLSNRTNDLVFEPNYGATYFAGSPSIKDRLLGLVAPLINTSKMKRLVRKRNIFEEGQFTSMIPEDKHPYGAYWWPHSGLPLITGDYSPLAKYDRFVRGKTGVDPMSRKWESDNHSLQHVEWGGHCNGWAASSILHKEATTIKWSREINHVILPSDFNGMLAEASFCVDLAFYGHRYNGTAGEDLKDISPEKFHQVLLYYIDQIKKPIATDYVQGVSVDNHVIVGYDMTITKDATLPNTYNVINELSMYGYDVNRNEVIGKSTESYTRRFTYQLTTDDTLGPPSAKKMWT
ncbi:MAG: hypothetical protein NTV34_14025 [Proteobacteria bacterium]|nr:hypothetical protein [Pseudomonadota bacterium]